MGTEENKALMRRVVEEAFNRRELGVLDELFAGAAFVAHYPGVTLRGAAALRGAVAQLHARFPDLHVVIDDLVAEGDKVTVRVTFRGTLAQEWHAQGLVCRPTGTPVTWASLFISRIADGKVAEEWEIMDRFGLLQQLGAIAAQAAPSASS